ncbi:MAG: type II secretion system F family protein [Deltaproteobacteria bacterium]|nr:MAG: type II secretion system F family protein [Deltaproteobacteria bacterium]
MSFNLILMIGFGFVVTGVFLVAGIGQLAASRTTSADRLAELTGKKEEEARAEREAQVAAAVAERLAALATSKDEEQRNLLREKLIHAGYRGKNALEVFNGVRVGLVFLLPLGGVFIASMLDLIYALGLTLILAAAGYMGPMYMVNKRIETRHKKLLQPFPDALDLLVTSVEAGLGLDMAFRRVSDEIRGSAPELAAEFRMVTYEVAAGVPRMEAFKRLADRTGLPEMKSLVNMMVQAERFGTSIASALRVHGDMVRQERMSRAEEEAAKVSPKLTVAMILFLMPCLLIVLIGPASIRVMKTFGMVE